MKRNRLFKRRYTKHGASPGTFNLASEGKKPVIRIYSYHGEDYKETTLSDWSEVTEPRKDGGVTWVDVQGVEDRATLTGLADLFQLHPLAIADVANVGQRPKVEDYGKVLFWVVPMAQAASSPESEIHWEQFALFLGKGFVLTFQEFPGDCLEPVRQRIRQDGKILRKSGADYLATMLMDTVVDHFFPMLESLGERLEALEEQLLRRPDHNVLSQVYRLKRELLHFRHFAWPLRDVLAHLCRDQHALLHEVTLPYLRDAADHVTQVVDVLETYREIATSFIDIYLSSLSNRTNEIMKVLTVLASIFIPLTFLAGVYGMNFNTKDSPWNMPELDWYYGYPLFWAVSLTCVMLLLLAFRRLGWLGSKEKPEKLPSTIMD